jgi:membrane protease YdiL (CAAX protease family)
VNAVGDAWRATAGVVAAFLAVLIVAAMVALLLGGIGDTPSAGVERAHLAVQAIGFCVAGLLLAEGLRLSRAPGGVEPEGARSGGAPDQALTVIAVGVACAVGAYLVGPLVAELWPALADRPTPVSGLGVGSGLGADLGTIVVVAGLIPLGEELLFRGVLAGAWLRAGRPGVAIVLSAVLFGLAHVTVGPRTVVIAALLGALLAAALFISGSLGAVVLAHGLINAIALLEAGLDGAVELAALAVVIILVTVVASRLSPLVSWLPPGGTLKQ